jgi:hypothetical protein
MTDILKYARHIVATAAFLTANFTDAKAQSATTPYQKFAPSYAKSIRDWKANHQGVPAHVQYQELKTTLGTERLVQKVATDLGLTLQLAAQQQNHVASAKSSKKQERANKKKNKKSQKRYALSARKKQDSTYFAQTRRMVPAPAFVTDKESFHEAMTILSKKESGWDPAAANSTSSARGYYQFIYGTAKDVGRELGMRYPVGAELKTHEGVLAQHQFANRYYEKQYAYIIDNDLKRMKKGKRALTGRPYSVKNDDGTYTIVTLTPEVLAYNLWAGVGYYHKLARKIDKQDRNALVQLPNYMGQQFAKYALCAAQDMKHKEQNDHYEQMLIARGYRVKPARYKSPYTLPDRNPEMNRLAQTIVMPVKALRVTPDDVVTAAHASTTSSIAGNEIKGTDIAFNDFIKQKLQPAKMPAKKNEQRTARQNNYASQPEQPKVASVAGPVPVIQYMTSQQRVTLPAVTEVQARVVAQQASQVGQLERPSAQFANNKTMIVRYGVQPDSKVHKLNVDNSEADRRRYDYTMTIREATNPLPRSGSHFVYKLVA